VLSAGSAGALLRPVGACSLLSIFAVTKAATAPLPSNGDALPSPPFELGVRCLTLRVSPGDPVDFSDVSSLLLPYLPISSPLILAYSFFVIHPKEVDLAGLGRDTGKPLLASPTPVFPLVCFLPVAYICRCRICFPRRDKGAPFMN